MLCTCASLLQDLVSKNEALRRQLHELQVHTEQQIRKKDAAAHTEEERRSQLYQKAMDEAKQRIAEHVVGVNIATSLLTCMASRAQPESKKHLAVANCVLRQTACVHMFSMLPATSRCCMQADRLVCTSPACFDQCMDAVCRLVCICSACFDQYAACRHQDST